MARVKYYDSADNTWKYADDVLVAAPVLSVNGKTGSVSITAADTGAEPVGAISDHNRDNSAHEDIRGLMANAMLKSDIFIKKAKLTLEDGSQVLIDVVVASEGTTIQSYTNQVPLSIDTNGNIYNGVGYEGGLRLSSSGTPKAQEGSYVTGFIPVKGGDVVRIFGCTWATTAHAGNYICAYDASFSHIGAVTTQQGEEMLYVYGTEILSNYEIDADGNVVATLAELSNIAYIRVNSRGDDALADPTDMIVTINQGIE